MERLFSNCNLLIPSLLIFQDSARNFCWSQHHVRYYCLKILRVNHCDRLNWYQLAMHVLICKMVCCTALSKLNILEINRVELLVTNSMCPGIRVLIITEVWNLVFQFFHVKESGGGRSTGLSA